MRSWNRGLPFLSRQTRSSAACASRSRSMNSAKFENRANAFAARDELRASARDMSQRAEAVLGLAAQDAKLELSIAPFFEHQRPTAFRPRRKSRTERKGLDCRVQV